MAKDRLFLAFLTLCSLSKSTSLVLSMLLESSAESKEREDSVWISEQPSQGHLGPIL